MADIIVGERTQFESGAVRSAVVAGATLEKPTRFDLISPYGLRRLAETAGEGAVKYSPNNWRRGIPASDLLNHALAHIVAYMTGDRSEDHMAHASWNLFAVMEFEATRPELIDVPPDLRDAAAPIVGAL